VRWPFQWHLLHLHVAVSKAIHYLGFLNVRESWRTYHVWATHPERDWHGRVVVQQSAKSACMGNFSDGKNIRHKMEQHEGLMKHKP
jgi:hypothetical protein